MPNDDGDRIGSSVEWAPGGATVRPRVRRPDAERWMPPVAVRSERGAEGVEEVSRTLATTLAATSAQAAAEIRRSAEVKAQQEEEAFDAWEDGLRKAARRARLLGGPVEHHELADLRLSDEQLPLLREAGILALREPPTWQSDAPS